VPQDQGLGPNIEGFVPDDGSLPDDGDSYPFVQLVLGLLLVAGVVGPWLVRRFIRFRRRAHGSDDQITAAWARARAAAADAGVAGSPAMTTSEWTAATADVLPVAARPMGSLAEMVDRVTFSAPGTVDLDHAGTFGDQLGDDCELWSQQVERIATDTLGPTARLKRYFVSYR